MNAIPDMNGLKSKSAKFRVKSASTWKKIASKAYSNFKLIENQYFFILVGL